MSLILQVFYSVFSGLLLAAAIPSEFCLYGIPSVTLLALIPLYFALSSAKNYKQAFLSGFIQTTVTHLCSSFWLANFKDFALMTLGASAIGTGLIGGFTLMFFHLPFSTKEQKNLLLENSLLQKFTDSSVFKILYFATVYTIYEWCKSVGFLGYPWATLSATIYKWPHLMQLASITGTYGISWLLAMENGILAELLLLNFNHYKNSQVNRKWSLKITATLFGILMSLTLIHGLYQYHKKRVPYKYLTAILVQQNSDPWKEEFDDDSILNSQKLTKRELEKLRENGEQADIIVWSEGTLKYRFPKAESHYRSNPDDYPLADFVKDMNIPLLTGGSYTKDRKNHIYFNASIMYDKDGHYRGVYGKNHLVPMAEAIPGMEIPFIKKFMSNVIGISAGWTPGDQYVFFDIPCQANPEGPVETVKTYDLSKSFGEQKSLEALTPVVKISAPICYDDAFPDIMRPLFLNGSEVFMNITDDSWSLLKSSEYQHYIISTYRSIEYRIPLVRSTNAGCTVVIDANGETLAMLPLFTLDAMSYKIPVYHREMTTYARFGNWLPYTLIILCFVYIIYTYTEYQKPDYVPSERKIKKHSKKKTKK